MNFRSNYSLPVLCAALFAATPVIASARSLWVKEGNLEQSMFADNRARNIGDILTIVIQEDTSTSQSAKTKTFDSM